MVGEAEARLLDDGRRLHLHHGPIDLVIGASGEAEEIALAYGQARDRFAGLLATLTDELVLLRRPVTEPRWQPQGPVAKRMMDAVWPHRGIFVTPMAAVAGAVADEVLAACVAGRDLKHCWVNNSGDIAFHLAPGETLTLGVVGDLRHPAIDAVAKFEYAGKVRGVATSGWAGRSQSLGIADAVTVLAANAASAAATLIANDVDIDHPAIERRPADELDEDSDLGERLVTIGVGDLDAGTVFSALGFGIMAAETLRGAGLIEAAVLLLKGQARVVGDAPPAIV